MLLKDTKILQLEKLEENKGQIDGIQENPRKIQDDRFEKLKKSIKESPDFLELRELIVYPYKDKFVIIAGNMRYKALKELGKQKVNCKILEKDTPKAKINEFIIKDNIGYGDDDFEKLSEGWDLEELQDWGLEARFIDEEEDLGEFDDLIDGNTSVSKKDNSNDTNYIIRTDIVFDNEAQKEAYLDMIEKAKDKYDVDTVGEVFIYLNKEI